MDREQKLKKITIANGAIKIIAAHGRKFFSLHAEGKTDVPERISRFELRDGRLFFVDKYSQKSIYVAYRRGRWSGFSEGGTLRALICAMADWISGKRDDFPINHLGPWPQCVCDGDLWGYGESMSRVRNQIRDLVYKSQN